MSIDFYSQIHKALRRCLYLLATETAATDFTAMHACHDICERISRLGDLLRSHAQHEEAYIHPLVSKKFPEAAQKMDQAHITLECEFSGIIKHSKDLLITDQAETRNSIGLTLYKEMNCFIARYILHLEEEESLMPALQNNFTEDELSEVLNSLIKSISMQELINSLEYILPAINPEERLIMISNILKGASSESAHEILDKAQQSLVTKDWIPLKNALTAPTGQRS